MTNILQATARGLRDGYTAGYELGVGDRNRKYGQGGLAIVNHARRTSPQSITYHISTVDRHGDKTVRAPNTADAFLYDHLDGTVFYETGTWYTPGPSSWRSLAWYDIANGLIQEPKATVKVEELDDYGESPVIRALDKAGFLIGLPVGETLSFFRPSRHVKRGQ